MELLKLSKFKLQLQALLSELRHLREKQNSASQQCHFLIKKQKQIEEEYGRKLQELQSELASSNELSLKLERKVNYLQNDNALLESKQKELQERIQNLLQSRESFIYAYEESTYEMKRSIEARDRKLNVLSEKLKSHLSLFDSIEKESSSIKQLMNNMQCLVSEKEEVVVGLKSKVDKVSAFEKVFLEKVFDLENKLKSDEDELRKKDKLISELEAQLEAAKIRINCQAEVEEKTLSAKDSVIQNLISEKEALHCEVRNLAIILQKVKETVKNMDEEDKRIFSPALKSQEDNVVFTNEDNRTEAAVQNIREASQKKVLRINAAENQASSKCLDQNAIGKPQLENSHLGSCVSEQFGSSLPDSPCSEFQSAIKSPSFSVNKKKGHCLAAIQHLDPECSITQAEISESPG